MFKVSQCDRIRPEMSEETTNCRMITHISFLGGAGEIHHQKSHITRNNILRGKPLGLAVVPWLANHEKIHMGFKTNRWMDLIH